VVALAASAGGHREIVTILQDLPTGFAVPLLVTMHSKSRAAGSLDAMGRRVPFAVEWVKPGSVLTPGKVLVCPPGSFVDLLPDGTLTVRSNGHSADDRPIDHFFESVARSFGARAIGVILAGTHTDGVLGARQLHLAGGSILVKSEASAKYPELPRAAIQAGAADWVVPQPDLGRVIGWIVAGTHGPETIHRVLGDEGEIMEWPGAVSGPAGHRHTGEVYRTLFETIDEGLAICELVRDEGGRVIDYRFLDINPAFEMHIHLKRPEVIGRLRNEVLPEDQAALDMYASVVLSNRKLRSEYFSKALDQWYDITVIPHGGDRFSVVFGNITAHKRLEEQLHQAANLNAFRVKLNDALGPLSDPVRIMMEAMRVIGEELQADRVLYAEVDEPQDSYVIPENHVRGDTPKIVGRFSLKEFGAASEVLRQGQLLALDDVRTAPGLKEEERASLLSADVAATLGVPLIKDGRWVANFGVQHRTPREWTISETALLQETAERTWAALERARAEEALRQSESRYRLLHESLRDAFVQVDMQGNIISFNDIYCQMLGFSPDELHTLSYVDITPERWRAFEENIVREQVLPRGFSDVYEKEYRRKDGTVFPVELRTILARDPAGQPNAMWAIIRDITDRKRAEQALRESEARIQKALSIETVGVLFFRLDGHITGANDAFLKMSGYSHDELLQLNDWIELTTPEFMEVTSRAANELATTGETAPHEKQLIRKDGSHWWGLFAPTRLSADGFLSECVEFIIDISERRQFEEALRENEKQLQSLNESLEQKVEEKTSELRQLASELTRAEQRERNRISHILHDDLQQRIYAIQMQMSFLGQEIPRESEAARAELSNIQKELEDVLNIARHLSIDLNPPILRGEGLNQAISWLASKMHQQYGLSIEIQAGESFTIPDEELHVLLFNCVRELLFNIVKHAQTGHAEVRLQWVDSKLRIEVSDDGDGFAARATRRQSSDRPVEEEEIQPSFGLSTIRHQLSLYGGSMAIYSRPGDGTRIVLTVPISNAG
jgi:PAS domain S-box-containing protein